MDWKKENTVVTDEFKNILVTIDTLMTSGECGQLIKQANTKGWNESAPSGGGNGRTGREDPRTNSFCVFYDQQLADTLWNRVKHFLPKDLSHIPYNPYLDIETKGTEWKPVGVVDKLRIYKYDAGQEFPEHVDYKSGRNVVRIENGQSKVSFCDY